MSKAYSNLSLGCKCMRCLRRVGIDEDIYYFDENFPNVCNKCKNGLENG